jgi:hypothetical protein
MPKMRTIHVPRVGRPFEMVERKIPQHGPGFRGTRLWLVLAIVLAGCSTTKHQSIGPQADKAEVKLPVKFSGYKEAYAFIAKVEGIPRDADLLFQLAADSEIQIYSLDKPLTNVWVVTPHFYGVNGSDQIRGAQGNGGIYVLRILVRDPAARDSKYGFELIGFGAGNHFRFASVNGKPRFMTSWHMGASDHSESVYEWNGRFFEQAK